MVVHIDVKYNARPFPHAIVDNFYNDFELSAVWRELDFLTHPDKLCSENDTASAKSDGVQLKKNFGLFLDEAYANNRSISDILRIGRNTFTSEMLTYLQQQHWIFKYIARCSSDYMLLSYYENNSSYKPHVDKCTMTSLTHLFKQPKKFTGGDLVFTEFDNYTLPVQNNRCIIFPSIIEHAVTEVRLPEDEKMTGNGRYCVTHFFV